MQDVDSTRTLLKQSFLAAVVMVEGRRCVAQFLRDHPLHGDHFLIAIGKAAMSMAQGACQELRGRLRGGLVITKQIQGLIDCGHIRILEAGHPLPDQRSLEAGDELLRFIDSLPPQAPVLFLLSGGASALVEVLPDAIEVARLADINQWLLGSGLSIAEMNAVRKRLSCIKGGRLARKLTGHVVTCLAISDVQGDDPRVIGSGLLVPDPALRQPLPFAVPHMIQQALGAAPTAPAEDEPCFGDIRFHIIANLEQAKQAAAALARSQDYKVTVHENFIAGDALLQGAALAQQLMAAEPGVHIWGGETTVNLPPQPGRGGRSQSLALSAALTLQGCADVILLAAGTDGNDGPEDDAGAIVDGATVGRGEKTLGKSAADCLAQADAGSFLAASGDLLHTGPTGTNVMDLVIGIKIADQHER
jgi:glycerate 2-kinase